MTLTLRMTRMMTVVWTLKKAVGPILTRWICSARALTTQMQRLT